MMIKIPKLYFESFDSFEDNAHKLKDPDKTRRSIYARFEAIEYYLEKKELTQDEKDYINMFGGVERLIKKYSILLKMIGNMEFIIS